MAYVEEVCVCLITGRELISVDVCGSCCGGLCLCDHRQKTNFSGCMWLMLRVGHCLCDHREGTNFSGCMWLMLRWVCDFVITGSELFQSLYLAYVEEKVCVCLITGRELISVHVCGSC